MWTEYGLDWIDAIRVVVSCIVFYGGVLLLVRVLGQRTLASLSSFDLAAIIALGAINKRPWVDEGELCVRDVTTLSLSFDHRHIDGEKGSRFLADVAGLMADPASALLF